MHNIQKNLYIDGYKELSEHLGRKERLEGMSLVFVYPWNIDS